MATKQYPEFKDFLAQMNIREKAIRRKTLTLTILPAIMALILLGYSILRVTGAEKRVTALRKEETRLNIQLKEKQDQLQALSVLTTKSTLKYPQPGLGYPTSASTHPLPQSTLGPPQDEKPLMLQQIPPQVRDRLELVDLSKKPQGYLLVLGSFKNIENAIRQVQAYRQKISPDIKLYYAINDYYTVAQGIITNKKEALTAMNNAHIYVADAYIFSSTAFPYELKLKNQ